MINVINKSEEIKQILYIFSSHRRIYGVEYLGFLSKKKSGQKKILAKTKKNICGHSLNGALLLCFPSDLLLM